MCEAKGSSKWHPPEFEIVAVPSEVSLRDALLPQTGSVSLGTLTIGPDILLGKKDHAEQVTKFILKYTAIEQQQQRIVLSLLGADISQSARLLFTLERDLEKRIDKISKEYADAAWNEAYQTLNESLEQLKEIRNHFVHRNWGQVSEFPEFALLIPSSEVLNIHKASIENLWLQMSGSPTVDSLEVDGLLKISTPDWSKVKIWKVEDLRQCLVALQAAVYSLIALRTALERPAGSIERRKEVLHFVKKYGLLSMPADAYFAYRE